MLAISFCVEARILAVTEPALSKPADSLAAGLPRRVPQVRLLSLALFDPCILPRHQKLDRSEQSEESSGTNPRNDKYSFFSKLLENVQASPARARFLSTVALLSR